MSGNLESVLDAIQRNADTSARLLIAAEAIRKAQEAPAAPASGGHATIQVNAGGAGLWAAVTACCVMLAVNIFLAFWLGRIDRENSEHGHQLNAIYMMAPHLKEKDKNGN
jgi:hypothetical protein